MGSTRLCLSRWVVLLCHLFALSNFSKLTNFEAIPAPKRLEVSTSQFYRFTWNCSENPKDSNGIIFVVPDDPVWTLLLDGNPGSSSKAFRENSEKNFKQLMILMCLARYSNDKCLEQNDISSDESWHHHDITMTFSWHPPFHVKQIKQICENWCSVMAHLRVSRSMV